MGPELGEEKPGVPPQALGHLFPGVVPQLFYCHQPKNTQIREFCDVRTDEELELPSVPCGAQA